MTTIAIIIPFYQEKAGILSRALASVFAQDVADARLRVVVVDDASPHDPARDIEAVGAPPAHVSVELVRRANGGPGAARNTGLDLVAASTEVIALLDSDDIWRPHHLSRALIGLNAGHEVYFSDYDQGDGTTYLPLSPLARRIEPRDPGLTDVAERMLGCAAALMAQWATENYIAHTSSLAYRARGREHVRVSELLRAAGEDHLFFMDLLLASEQVCFSLDIDEALGEGVNIHKGAFAWGTDRDLRRRAFYLGVERMMLARTTWPPAVAAQLRASVAESRRMVGYLLTRAALTGRLARGTLGLIWRIDKKTVLLAPAYAGCARWRASAHGRAPAQPA